MLEMAATGGRVLMLRAVEFARNHNVPLHVRSSFTWEPGTWVVEEDADMEDAVVTAVTHDTSEAKVTVSGVPDRPGVAAAIFTPLADEGINVDLVVQNVSHEGTTDVSFTIAESDLDRARPVLDQIATTVGGARMEATADIAKVSVVGSGILGTPGVLARIARTLAHAGINIQMISTSEIRVTCIIDGSRVEDAVRALHAAFELDRI